MRINLQYPLLAYHHHIKHIFDPMLQEERIQEIAFRILTVAISPIAYPLLGLTYLIGKYLFHQIDPVVAIERGKHLWQQIESMDKTKIGWQEKAIALVRKSRFDNPELELLRLQSADVLRWEEISKTETALSKIQREPNTPFLTEERKTAIKALLGQALEIKKIYGKTHHVFLHSQASGWMILVHLVKEMMKKTCPSLDVHQFKYLRAPCETAKKGLIESAYGLYVSLWKELKQDDIRRYSERTFLLSDGDSKVREELISADGYFYNHHPYESSLHFLSNNSNIRKSESEIQKIYKTAIQHFFPNLKDSEINQFARELSKLKQPTAPSGNLFVFCFPKQISEKVQYRAHPFGKRCDCHDPSEDRSILEKLQAGYLDASNHCNRWPSIPQFRIFTPNLTPGRDRIYMLSPLKKGTRQKIKQSVRSIVHRMTQYA